MVSGFLTGQSSGICFLLLMGMLTFSLLGITAVADETVGSPPIMDCPEPIDNLQGDGKPILKCPVPKPYCGDGTCQGDESCSSCSQDCGSCSSGSGGGGNGGGSTPSIILIFHDECHEYWECEAWGECNDGQERKCWDNNDCGTVERKPAVVKGCPPTCEDGLHVCDGDDLVGCLEGDWEFVGNCEFGCQDGECIKEKSIELSVQLEQPPSDGASVTGNIVQAGVKSMFLLSALVILIEGGMIYWAGRKRQ